MAIELTRQQLYERVWSSPVSKIAPEFGLSDVGLAKACRKLKVPVPSVGYWAKLAAGKNPPKTPLPNIAGDYSVGPDEIAEQQKQTSLALPGGNAGLHPMVRKFGTALREAKPNYWNYHEVASYREGISVSEPRINKALRALHALVVRLETRGVEFRPSTWSIKHARPTFRKGRASVVLGIQELRETFQPLRPTGSYGENERPSGRLEFNVVTGYGHQGRETFAEKPETRLEELLHKVAERIWAYFVDWEERAKKAAEDHAKWLEAEKIRQETQRRVDHEKALARVVTARRVNFRRAAHRWRLHREALDLIAECQRRWGAQGGTLTPQQLAWTEWARREADELSPFEKGYPQPATDGAFDPAQISFGGPYPATTFIT